MSKFTNSALVDFTQISPNRTSPRNHAIDTITIHCYVGQVTVERMGKGFAKESKKASCNYGIGLDGKIGMYVEEKDRAWCSGGKDKNGNPIRVNGISGADNDHRAITIECACDSKSPYAINDKVYASLIKLCADICKRNNIKELKWKADKKLVGQIDMQNMTVHRWFANKACPGKYIYDRLGQIAADVNAELAPKPKEEPKPKTVKGTGTADYKDKALSGSYVTTANLHLRNDAGTTKKSLIVIPKGTTVKNYGYYSLSSGVKWLYITFTLKGTTYTGFSSIRYLKKK